MTREQEQEIEEYRSFLEEARDRVDRAVDTILSDLAEEDTIDMAEEGEQ